MGSPFPARRLRLSFLVVAACWPRSAGACDSSACQLVTRGQNGVLARGAFRLDVSFRHTDESLLLEGGTNVDRVLRPKVDFENQALRLGYHDELGGSDSFVQLDAAYGLTSRLTLQLSLPLFAKRSYDIGHAPIASENYTTRGNGDVLLGARYGARVGRGSLTAGLSLEMPTGRHDLESPAGRVDRGILDPMLQPGSGSWDLVASGQYAARWTGAGLDCGVAGSYQSNTQNDLDYRFGDVAIASLNASRALGSRVSGSLQLKGVREARSRYMGEPLPSTGGRFVYLIPGLSLATLSGGSVYVFVPLPVYRFVNEAQLAPRPSLVVGVSHTF